MDSIFIKGFLILCINLIGLNQLLSQNSSSSQYVFVPDGLSMKDKPSLWGKRLAVIPYGTELELKNQEKHGVITQLWSRDSVPLLGYWLEVEYKGQTGFVFEAYVLDLPPPRLDVYQNKSVWEYFDELVGCKDPKCNHVSGQETRNGELKDCANQTDYNHGIIYVESDCYLTEAERDMSMGLQALYFEEHDFQDLYILARVLYFELNQKDYYHFEYDHKDKEIHYNGTVELRIEDNMIQFY